MERTDRVQLWAGTAMLALCLLIGVVEGRAVLDASSWPYAAGWLAAYLLFLVGGIATAWARTPADRLARAVLIGVPVLGAAAVVLASPQRSGLILIVLVLAAGLAALHATLRTMALIILGNSIVVAANAAALGPLGQTSGSMTDILLATLLYGLLQAGSATMIWSQKRVEEALEEVSVAHVELRSTSVLLAESSQAEERLRISRELHDILGHQLTVLSVELEVASHLAEGRAHKHVLRARSMAKDLLSDVRSAVGAQRERAFDLPTALARVVEGVPSPQVHLEVEPDMEVDDAQAAVLVRAVQEITTNTIRHAQAQRLGLRVTRDGGVVRLDAQDDGVGAREQRPGHGLRGLGERVQALGGQVRVDGSRGFRVTVELPTESLRTASAHGGRPMISAVSP